MLRISYDLMNQEKPKKENAGAPAKQKIDLDKLPKPEFVEHRIKIWDEWKAKREAEKKGELLLFFEFSINISLILTIHSDQPQKPIKITLPDGKEVDGVAGQTTPLDIAKKISKGLAEAVVVAKVCISTLRIE